MVNKLRTLCEMKSNTSRKHKNDILHNESEFGSETGKSTILSDLIWNHSDVYLHMFGLYHASVISVHVSYDKYIFLYTENSLAPLTKTEFHNPSMDAFDLEAITKKGYASVEIGTICLMAGKSTFIICNPLKQSNVYL